MQKLVAVLLLVLATSAVVLAGEGPVVPEIDPATGTSALALIASGLVLIRSRKK